FAELVDFFLDIGLELLDVLGRRARRRTRRARRRHARLVTEAAEAGLVVATHQRGRQLRIARAILVEIDVAEAGFVRDLARAHADRRLGLGRDQPGGGLGWRQLDVPEAIAALLRRIG